MGSDGITSDRITGTDEFQTLREEMLLWQGRRFDALKNTVIAVSFIVGGAQTGKWEWMLASACTLVILAIACYFTWLSSVMVIVGGSYIEVLLEGGWERRNRELRKVIRVPTMNRVLAFIYLFIAIVCGITCQVMCMPTSTSVVMVLWWLCAVGFALTLAWLALRSYPRSKLVDHWRKVKAEEQAGGDVQRSPSDQTGSAGGDAGSPGSA